jgi:pseudouridine-5'-phosphate glycosidase
MQTGPNPWIMVAPEVEAALANGRGVVALESTLIAHGLPWPDNVQTARAAEVAVRQAGAVPATIAVLNGVIRIGLGEAEIERIGKNPGAIPKASRRDLGAAIALREDAATTVSATLWVARQAGILVMATGGIGGVHRDAAQTFDISSDLDELAAAHGTLVVCSGVKSILDIGATLEALETRGVAVVGFATGELPAFTTRSSGQVLDRRVETPKEAAAIVRAHRTLGLPGSVVLAQAVDEKEALDPHMMETALAAALDQARARGITGKDVTPFLLASLHSATGGLSLRANRALVITNAGLAGAVAAALAER